MIKTEVAPQKVDKVETLNRNEILDKIGEKFGSVTSIMNEYLRGIHEELKGEAIVNSSQIVSVR